MITSQLMLSYVKAQLFRPFRIHIVSGKTFDIRHPEMVKVGKTYLVVFTYVAEDPEIVDRWETVSLLLIENISHLDAPVGQA